MSDMPFDGPEHEGIDSTEERALRAVRSFMDASRRYREPFVERALENYDLYRNHTQVKYSQKEQRANLKLPKAHELVQTILPQLLAPIQASSSYVKVEGQGPEDDDWADLINDFHSQQMRQMQFLRKYPAMLLDFIVAGTGFAKVPYRYKEKEIRKTVSQQTIQQDPTTGELFPVIERVKEVGLEVIFDGPDLDIISYFDFFPDVHGVTPGDIQSLRGCAIRFYKSFDELKRDKRRAGPDGEHLGKYINLDKLKASVMVRGNSAWKTPFAMNDGSSRNEEQLKLEDGIKALGKLEIWEYWGTFKKSADSEEKDMVITIANGDTVIGFEENPYDNKFKPFIAAVNITVPNEFYGDGDIGPVASSIKEMTMLRNARLDAINILIHPMWIVDRASGINTSRLTYAPGKAILTNQMDGIQPLIKADLPFAAYRDAQQIELEIQSTTGQYNAGQQSGNIGRAFSRTATGVSFLEQKAGSRIELKLVNLDSMFFRELGWMMLMHNRQFVTEERWVRVSDPNSPNPYAQLPPDAFFRNFDFAVGSTATDNVDFQKLQALSELLNLAETTQPGTVKFDVFLQDMGRAIVGNKFKKFVRSPEERAQLMQQGLIAQGGVSPIGGSQPAQQGQPPVDPNQLPQQ